MRIKAFAIISLFFGLCIAGCSNGNNQIGPSKDPDYFTVIWKNWDETVLEIDTAVEEGTVPQYNGDIPTREKDEQYSYSFSGWSPTIKAVSSDITYVAQYSSSVNKYTVTWKNWDGSILETDENVPYGTTPSYDGLTPSKPSDDQSKYYDFSGWSPTLEIVKGNVTYTATFEYKTYLYTVIWKNWDGSILETDENVPYGTTPSYDGDTPTRPATAQYTYLFSNWSPNLTAVTANVVYTAQYSNTLNSYTVTWKNWDGSILETDENVPYGTTPSYDGSEPTRDNTAQFSYTFSGWSPSIVPVEGSVVYTAQFASETNSYTVTWKNWDGSILETDENVPYGTTPSYDGSEPSKAGGDEQYGYEFIGWDPVVDSVKGDAEYTALFEYRIRKYLITWKNWDGGVLKSEKVPYGSMPSYNLSTPSKAGDAQYSYSFTGWSPEIVAVISDAIYTAQFEQSINSYTITWKNWDDSVLKTEVLAYGSTPTYTGATPTKNGTAQYSYTFTGWSPSITTVTKDATYKANFSSSINNYKITWKNWDDSVLKSETLPYGSTPKYTGTTPERESEDDQYVYTFTGWSPTISSVTANATYYANYSKQLNNKITALSTDSSAYNVALGFKKTINIVSYPSSASIYTLKVVSSNSSVVGIEGEKTIVGKSKGTATVTITANEVISTQIQVTVIEKEFEFELYDGYVMLSDYYGLGGSVEIPSTYNGVPVTSISENAFRNNNNSSQITTLVVPNSITSLPHWCFYYLTSIKSVTLPFVGSGNSSTNAFGYVFKGTNSSLPSSLKEAKITDDVTVKKGAFSDCISLNKIAFTNPNVTLEQGVLYGCTSLTSLSLPSTAFTYSTNLEQLFYKSTSSYSLSQILTRLYISNGKSNTANANFASIKTLEEIEILDGTDVNLKAANFSSGTNLLTRIKIGDSVKSINSDTFNNYACVTQLETIEVSKNNQYYSSRFGSLFSKDLSTLYKCPPKKTGSMVVPHETTSISQYAFYKCDLLEYLSVPFVGGTASSNRTLVYIFYNQKPAALKTVYIQDGCTSIADNAFNGLSSIEQIRIPDSVTSIGSYAFYGCSALVVDELSNSINQVGEYAFASCKGITSFTVPSGITKITKGMFASCSNLASITIPEGITAIEDEAFSGCTSLKQITLPNTLQSIGSYAFSNCSSIENIVLPDSLTTLKANAFSSCTKLKSIKLGSGLQSFNGQIVYGCSSLTSIDVSGNSKFSFENGSLYNADKTSLLCVMPGYSFSNKKYYVSETVTYIGSYAFTTCANITSVRIPEGATNLGSYAFYSCSSLTNVLIPHSMINYGSYCFSSCNSCYTIFVNFDIYNQYYFENRIGSNNSWLKSHAKYYADSSSSGSGRWHFDSNGEPVLW